MFISQISTLIVVSTIIQGMICGSTSDGRLLEALASTLTIVEHPSDTTVIENEPVTLNCKAAVLNHGTHQYNSLHEGRDPLISIQWFHNGKQVRTNSSPVSPSSLKSSSKQVLVTGAASSQHRILLPDGSLFFLRAVRGEDDGTYWCLASYNKGEGVLSTNGTLRVAYLEDEFENSPADTQAVLGSQLELQCDPPSGFPYPVIRWKKDGQYLDLTSSQRLVILQNGHLRIMELVLDDGGSYQCTATNMAGTRETKPSSRIQVLRPPYFTKRPESNTTVIAGQDILLGCIGEGDPQPKTKWTRIGSGFPPEGLVLDLPNYKVVPGKGLRLTHVHTSQAGLYSCTLTSSIGTTSAITQLEVHEAPIITVRPRSEILVTFGETVTLECLATGSPTPVLLWMHEKDRTVLLPGDRTDSGLEVTDRGFLRIASVRFTSTYVCMVINIVGAAMSRSTLILETVGKKSDHGVRAFDENVAGPSIQALQVHGTSSTSIKVSWRLTPSPPSHHIRHLEPDDVDGFYILYRPRVGRPPGFTSITVLHAAATSYVVNRLEPFTPYEFLVVPFYKGLAGQPSALYGATTLEARPTQAPTQLAWYQVNASSVDILWKPIPESSFRGKPVGYQVMILQEGGRVAANRSLLISPTDGAPHLLMSNLEPRHTYFIQVAAFTSRGIGPFSEVLKVRPEPSLALSGASQVAITDIDEYMGRHSTNSNSSGWIVPLLVVGLVVFVSALATVALIYVHRQRIKTSENQGAQGPNAGAQTANSNNRRPCRLHLPAALITLTTHSPKFRMKLRKNGHKGIERHKRDGLEGDFQLLATPLSSSSARCSFPAGGGSEDGCKQNTYCSLKRFGGGLDEGEAAFLEVRHKAGGQGASSAETMWIDREDQKNVNKEGQKNKKKHFIYATMSRITMCSGLQDKSNNNSSRLESKSDPKRLKLRSGLLLSERKVKRCRNSRRGESEEESDYAYIDRSTHSITGYLNMEAKNGQSRVKVDPSHSMSTFSTAPMSLPLPLIENRLDDEDPLSPYATTQVLLANQQFIDPLSQQQMVTSFHDGCRLSSGNLMQPLNVNTFLCPDQGAITDASEHLYAVVATSNHNAKFRPHSFLAISRDGSAVSSSLSRHSSLSLLDQVRPPNLRDLIPPPPLDDPPLCLLGDHQVGSPLWHHRASMCTFQHPSDIFCSGDACCHPLAMQAHSMESNCQLQCGEDCIADNIILSQGKPRARKMSSPNKRSLARQRNKAKASLAGTPLDGNPLLDIVPLKAPRHFLKNEKCLSDNDGDDESEGLSLLVRPDNDPLRGTQMLTTFASMPRQGRRKRKESIKGKEKTWIVQNEEEREKEREPLLVSSLTQTAQNQNQAQTPRQIQSSVDEGGDKK